MGQLKATENWWNSKTLLASLRFEISLITSGHYEFIISSKNKQILVVEGHEFYVKRVNRLPGKDQNIKARSAAFQHLHKIANLFK